MWQVGTIRIGRIGGIAIDVHVTFALVILWGGWQGWYQHRTLLGIVYGILLIVLLFICILLHELGHGLQAKAFGLVARRITLLPIGGLAQLASMPVYPSHELMIALAGPAVNLALAGILGLISFIINPLTPATWLEQSLDLLVAPPGAAALLWYLVGSNLILFIFNMLPAFPMDGGRVLRAGLAMILDYEVATRVSAWLGRIVAVAMGVFGLVGWPPAGIAQNPLLLLIAFMIFFGAQHEEIYVRRQRALVRVEVGEITRRLPETLAPWDSITGNLITRLFRQEQTLPVLVEDRVVGLLTYHDVRRFQGRSAPATVAHAMRTHFPSLQLTDTLWVALQEMYAFQLPILPVVDNGIFQGVVCLNDINHAWRVNPRRRRGDPTFASGDTVSQ